MPTLKELVELNRLEKETPAPKETKPKVKPKAKSKAKPKPKPKDDDLFDDSIDESDVEVITKLDKIEDSKKFPLEQIPISKGILSDPMILEKAKQRILNDIHIYNFTLKNIVNNDDFALINGNNHLCRSGTRKIQLALNISTKIIDEDIQRIDNEWIAKYRVRAVSPNGRSAEAVGACAQGEKGKSRTYHDTIATAETRASSRAIMNLVGWGAVTSDEIQDSQDELF